MRKYLLVILAITLLYMLGFPGCGQKEQAEQEEETAAPLEEEADFSREMGGPEGEALNSTYEEESELEETHEGPHMRAFDEGEEIDEMEGVYEEELTDEEEWEEEPLPEDTKDE